MRIYVHGNCQAPAIAYLLRQLHADWDIGSYEVFSEKIVNEIDRYHHYVETADIILSQPVQDMYRDRDDLSLSWVRASAKSNVQFIMFPSMFFDGQLVGCRSTKIPSYGMAYHDALLIHLVVAGVQLSDMVKILLAEDLYSDAFIRNEITLSLAEMRRREEASGIDVSISPFLETYAAGPQIFHTINHPCGPALAYVANQVLTYLGYPARVPTIGVDYLRFPHIPCLPSVERFIRTNDAGPAEWRMKDGELYHLPAERLTRAEYLERAKQHLSLYNPTELLSYLNEPHIRSFLNRLGVSVPSLPGIKMWVSTE